jgi:hypothetical protein
MRETPSLLGRLETDNLSEDGNTFVSETLCFLLSRISDDGQSQNPSNFEYLAWRSVATNCNDRTPRQISLPSQKFAEPFCLYY